MRWSGGRRSERTPRAPGTVALADGERVLVEVTAVDGTVVVGTDRALHLGAGQALGWHQIDRARWLGDDSALEVVSLPSGSSPAQTYRVAVPEPGRLPELVRERVTSTIVVSERVLLAGRASARIVARRVPGADGVRWSVLYEDSVSATEPGVQAAAHDAVAGLRARLGV